MPMNEKIAGPTSEMSIPLNERYIQLAKTRILLGYFHINNFVN